MSGGSDYFFERKLGKKKLSFNYFSPDDSTTAHHLIINDEEGETITISITELLKKAKYKIKGLI